MQVFLLFYNLDVELLIFFLPPFNYNINSLSVSLSLTLCIVKGTFPLLILEVDFVITAFETGNAVYIEVLKKITYQPFP